MVQFHIGIANFIVTGGLVRYTSYDIVFQEVPDEISLCFSINGCKLNCRGCHSPHLLKNLGDELTYDFLETLLKKYKNHASNVLFMGGEWDDVILEFLQLSRNYKYKTTLYTGLTLVEMKEKYSNILHLLDYIKVGRWDTKLGGLSCNTTNQRFYKLPDYTDLTYKFQQ